MTIQGLVESLSLEQVVEFNRLLGFRVHSITTGSLYEPQDLRSNLIEWFKHHTSLYSVEE